MFIVRIVAAALALIALTTPGTASAEWRRAETPRFIVYSDGDARSLAEAAQELELYDSALRFMHGLDVNAAPARKLSIYLVGDTATLREVAPGASEMIRGFYRAGDEDIYAIAIRERRNMRTLLHEYAHHFMLQNFATGYPAWLVEGYAEYFGTADVDSRQITIGMADANRQAWLGSADWLPLRDILTRHPSEFRTGEQVSQFYGQSWMLTHWFMSSPDRLLQLVVYADNLRAGMDPVEALEVATGMSLSDLERSQRAYARQRLALKRFSATQFPQPSVEMTTLPPGAGDLLMLNLRLSGGVAEADQAELLNLIRTRAGAHPDDPFAQTVLARAEAAFGDPAAGEALMQRRLQTRPDDVDALLLLARLRLKAAEEAVDGDLAPAREARAYLVRAYEADPERYQTLQALDDVRRMSSTYPTDNDMERLLIAYDLAPQVSSIRFAAAQAHVMRAEYAEAIRLLEPLAGDPHSAPTAEAARTMIERARARQDDADEDEATSSGE